MRKGLYARVVRDIAGAMDRDWRLVGRLLMRRSSEWVQVVAIDPSEWSDDFIPWAGLVYLRAWDPIPRISGSLARSRLQGERHPVDRWISFRQHASDPSSVIDLMISQFRPRIDEPLDPSAAIAVVRERPDEWPCRQTLVVLAAVEGNGPAALEHLKALEELTEGRGLEDYLDEARRVVSLMDRPADLTSYLKSIEEGKLASLKRRPLG